MSTATTTPVPAHISNPNALDEEIARVHAGGQPAAWVQELTTEEAWEQFAVAREAWRRKQAAELRRAHRSHADLHGSEFRIESKSDWALCFVGLVLVVLTMVMLVRADVDLHAVQSALALSMQSWGSK